MTPTDFAYVVAIHGPNAKIAYLSAVDEEEALTIVEAIQRLRPERICNVYRLCASFPKLTHKQRHMSSAQAAAYFSMSNGIIDVG